MWEVSRDTKSGLPDFLGHPGVETSVLELGFRSVWPFKGDAQPYWDLLGFPALYNLFSCRHGACGSGLAEGERWGGYGYD